MSAPAPADRPPTPVPAADVLAAASAAVRDFPPLTDDQAARIGHLLALGRRPASEQRRGGEQR